MAWTVWRGYVAVVAMALAMAPMRKISAEDIYGGRQRFNKLPSVFSTKLVIDLLKFSHKYNSAFKL